MHAGAGPLDARASRSNHVGRAVNLRRVKGGWAYTVGESGSRVEGWHRDKDEAIRLATAYQQRLDDNSADFAEIAIRARWKRPHDGALSHLLPDDE